MSRIELIDRTKTRERIFRISYLLYISTVDSYLYPHPIKFSVEKSDRSIV